MDDDLPVGDEASLSEEAYYRRHVMRHGDARNRWAVFVGDNLVLLSVLLLLRGRLRRAARLYTLGVATTVLGHLAFDHNLGEELQAIRDDPQRSLRAEARFLRGLWLKGPSAFDPRVD
jgi:hypothetical protein